MSLPSFIVNYKTFLEQINERLRNAGVEAKCLDIIAFFLAVLAISIYGGLVPAGRWQGDEYFNTALISHMGWRFIPFRVVGWSPRPFSELLVYLYLSASNALNRPLIGSWLTLLWGVSLMAALFAAWRARLPLTLALGLYALSLLIAQPGEMFYWPMAASAYLPAWGGMLVLTLALLGKMERGREPILAAALFVMAWSMEAGTVTALVFSTGEIVLRVRKYPWRSLWPFFGAIVAAFLIGLLFAVHRGQDQGEIVDAASGIGGHWGKSIWAALPPFLHQLFTIGEMPLWGAISLKALLLVLAPSTPATTEARVERLLWSLVLLGGAFATIAAGFHQFGADPIAYLPRLSALVQIMILLALVSVGGVFIQSPPLLSRGALIAATSFLFLYHVGDLAHDYALKDEIIATRAHNWAVGLAPGEEMDFRVAPPGRVVNGDAIPYGTYADEENRRLPWYAVGILRRFHKKVVVITPAP